MSENDFVRHPTGLDHGDPHAACPADVSPESPATARTGTVTDLSSHRRVRDMALTAAPWIKPSLPRFSTFNKTSSAVSKARGSAKRTNMDRWSTAATQPHYPGCFAST